MTIFHITSATSVFNNSLATAFTSDSSGADALIMDSGAFLVSTGGGGAALAATGAWTVTVNGSIVGSSSPPFDFGILLEPGNAAVSTITIGVDGEVQGVLGMDVESPAKVNNAGAIVGSVNGIALASGGTHVITNSGEISAPTAINVVGTSSDTVRNSGTIIGSITLSAGNDAMTNSGILSSGDLSLGDGTNRLTNTGVISDDIVGGSGADTVTNFKVINGFVIPGDGNNTLVNAGTINGEVHGGSGTDTVTDFAIVSGVMQSGKITGTISLGDGNDKFTGGANSETVQDGNGADSYKLGGGNDTYIATGSFPFGDETDVISGGAGVDTYDRSFESGNNLINLDTVVHNFPGVAGVAANTAAGDSSSGIVPDQIFGFENANGGSGNDVIFGSAAGNALKGGDGNDFLAGFGGNDTLDGGLGDDTLVGGAGEDQLTGGSGVDNFLYTALSDSGITATTRDLVADFEQGSDSIDLTRIDANTTNAAGTNDAFTFIGTNTPFTGSAGQLHAFWSAIGQIVEGDVNGDEKPDFSIEIKDPTHAITLTSGSFIL